jgi:hypothetical protein
MSSNSVTLTNSTITYIDKDGVLKTEYIKYSKKLYIKINHIDNVPSISFINKRNQVNIPLVKFSNCASLTNMIKGSIYVYYCSNAHCLFKDKYNLLKRDNTIYYNKIIEDFQIENSSTPPDIPPTPPDIPPDIPKKNGILSQRCDVYNICIGKDSTCINHCFEINTDNSDIAEAVINAIDDNIECQLECTQMTQSVRLKLKTNILSILDEKIIDDNITLYTKFKKHFTICSVIAFV